MGFLDRLRLHRDPAPAWPWFQTLDGGASWLWFATLAPAWFATLIFPPDCQPCALCNYQQPRDAFTTSDDVHRSMRRGRPHPILTHLNPRGGLIYPDSPLFFDPNLDVCNDCYTSPYCPRCGRHPTAPSIRTPKPTICETCAPYTPALDAVLTLARRLTGATATAAGHDTITIGTDAHGARVTLDRATRNKHLYLIGKSRTGKTTLMLNLMRADLIAGDGLTFIDPAGDAAADLLGLVPAARTDDVIFFDPTRADCPALNLFALPYDRDKLMGEILSVFELFFNISQQSAPRAFMLLRYGLLTLLDDRENEPHALADLERLYKHADYRELLAARAPDPRVKAFLTDDLPRFAKDKSALDPVLNKLDAFLSTRVLSRVFGSTTNALDFDALLNRRGVLVCSLSKGKIGEEAAKFLGGLIVAALTVAALARADQPPATRVDHFLYVDEFQNFAVESFATIFSEAAKYRLNLTVAHQTRDQLTPEIRAALGNASTYIVFRVSAPDASNLAPELARRAYVHKLTGDRFDPLATADADAAAVLAGTVRTVDGCHYYRDQATTHAAYRLLATQRTEPPAGDVYTLVDWPTSHAITNLKNLHAFARIERPENTTAIAVPFPPPPDPAAQAAVLEHQRQRHELERTAAAAAQEKNRPLKIPQEPRSSIETTQDPHENTPTLPPETSTVSVPIAGPNGDRGASPPDDDTDEFLT